MARKLTLSLIGATSLGYAHVSTQAQDIDWEDARGEDLDGCEVQLPPITYAVIESHAADLLTPEQARRVEGWSARAVAFGNTEVSEDLAEAFQESESYYEWKDGFEPMMNFVWPVMIRYGASAERLAGLLEEFAPTVSLVYFGNDSTHCAEEYGFALSGGGMNLSDQLAIAYLCAGHVPPSGLLEQLPGVIEKSKRDQVAGPLRAAYRQAAEWHKTQAKRVLERRASLFAKSKPATV